LVNITPISLWFMVQKHLITIVTGYYKPTYNWITIVTGANLNQDSLHWGGHE
jgi:hypothetical protein